MPENLLSQPRPGAPGGPLEIGQLLGNYRIVRQLGQGGMGAVFEAVHQYIERKAAIKVLHADLSQNQQVATRFLNEARAVNLIKHPGLVEIFEFGLLENGAAYIIMEFLEGYSLAQHLRHASGSLADHTLGICRQIAHAMSAVHQKGIVHRDLKPDKSALDGEPVLKA
jgi:serine/threonine protein kinase